MRDWAFFFGPCKAGQISWTLQQACQRQPIGSDMANVKKHTEEFAPKNLSTLGQEVIQWRDTNLLPKE